MNKIKLAMGVLLALSLHLTSFAQTPADIKTIKIPLPQSALQTELILVEGGTFNMGDSTQPDAKPIHPIKLNSFYIGKYEVTVAEWKAYCQATGKQMPDTYPVWNEPWRDDHPIGNITWFDAEEYCKWIGARLPTEAEWEYAARGGKYSKNLLYSGSSNIDEVSWHRDNSKDKYQKVGTKKPNELGLYDMSGNMWEWCQDWYDRKYYATSPKENPQGPATGVKKIRRGGSWFFAPVKGRVGLRDNYTPTTKLFGLGFRIVKNQ
jgi:formylglycine-generating enzyme